MIGYGIISSYHLKFMIASMLINRIKIVGIPDEATGLKASLSIDRLKWSLLLFTIVLLFLFCAAKDEYKCCIVIKIHLLLSYIIVTDRLYFIFHGKMYVADIKKVPKWINHLGTLLFKR